MAVPATPANFRLAHAGLDFASTVPVFRFQFAWDSIAPTAPPEVYELSANGPGYTGTEISILAAAGITRGEIAHVFGSGSGTLGYRLRARNADGASAFGTNLVLAQPTAPSSSGDLTAPNAVTVRAVTNTSAIVGWTDRTGLKTQNLIQVTSGGVTIPWIAPWDADEVLITGLNQATAYSVTVAAQCINGSSTITSAASAALNFNTATNLIDPVLPLRLYLGAPAVGGFHFYGPGVATSGTWSLTGGPAGVTIDDGTSLVTGQITGALSGAPTEPGIFSARVGVASNTGGLPVLTSVPVQITVDGGLFFADFHSDPNARDFVIDLRTGAVSGYYFEGEAGIRLPLGEDVPATVFLLGPGYLADATELSLRVFASDNFNAPPFLLKTITAPAAAVFGSITGLAFPFTVESPLLRQVFAAMNAPAVGDGATAQLPTSAEFIVTRGGVRRRSRPFRLTVCQ